MEDGASLKDLLGVAHNDLLAEDVSAARRSLGGIHPDALAAIEAEAKYEHPVILPGHNWTFMVAMWTQIGELERVENLIKSKFSLRGIKISVNDEVERERVGFFAAANMLELFINPIYFSIDYLLLLYRVIEIVPMLVYLADNIKQPLSARFSVGDLGCDGELSFSSGAPKAVLVPDNYFVGRNGYESERLLFASRRMAWTDRSTAVFWRGSTTGHRSGGWQSLPRIRLCQIANDNPHLPMDFGINQVVQQEYTDEETDIRSEGLMKPFIHSDNFDAYRYHIDIDGNSNSWPGLFIKLLSGGAVLKVASQNGYCQWYYDKLVPWVHYIPIAADMSDLIEKVEWITGHDDQARRIGQAGRAFALRMTLGTEAQCMVNTVATAMKSGVLG